VLATLPTAVTLRHIVQDPSVPIGPDQVVVGEVGVEAERFEPGPGTERVVVVDHGDFGPGIPVPLDQGRYSVRDEAKIFAPDFCALSAFSTVLRVLGLVEDPAAAGRRLRFPFEGRLRIEPLAGDWNNACYERATGSLRFWTFVPPGELRRRYLALSHDAVAHEAGHLCIDALAPDLHDATHPQSLGLHEALADLLAFAAAVQTPALLSALLAEGPGRTLDELALLTMIGETAGGPAGLSKPIRRLDNARHLDRARADADRVDAADPHALAEVMGGFVYDLLLRERGVAALDPALPPGALQPLSQALLQRVVAALLVLPPGECTFWDFARAMVAWARALGLPDAEPAVVAGLQRRGLLPPGAGLGLPLAAGEARPSRAGVKGLLGSARSAAHLARRHASLLGVDPGARLRARATPLTRALAGEERAMVLLQVSWDREEDNGLGDAFPARRRFSVGASLLFDADPPHAIRLVLPARPPEAQDAMDRTAFLLRLRDRGRLRPARAGATGLRWRLEEGRMRLEGAARALHVQPDAHGPAGGFREVPPDPEWFRGEQATAF
jgi:hypothetical protein